MTATITRKFFIRQTVTTDLHMDGNPECNHDFSPWETAGGVVEADGKLIAQFWFESNCRRPDCTARVGRRSDTEIATKPRRCPYCKNPEPNHVGGLHVCVHHDCPDCGVHHNKKLACTEAVD